MEERRRSVYIRPLNGSSTTIDTDMTATMLDLKKEYCRQAGVPVAEQTLIIGGFERANDVRLCDCNVDGNWNGVIHMKRTTPEQREEERFQGRMREIAEKIRSLPPEGQGEILDRIDALVQDALQRQVLRP